jgi:hypothetical protein
VTKITWNSISPSPYAQKLGNLLQEIPLIKGFLVVPRACPSFIKIFSFDLVELSLPKLMPPFFQGLFFSLFSFNLLYFIWI